MNLCDLSYFFNKYILWINPNHHFMKWRVFPLGFVSIPAARDYYIYISDE
jgi:phosphatidylserine synthase 2